MVKNEEQIEANLANYKPHSNAFPKTIERTKQYIKQGHSIDESRRRATNDRMMDRHCKPADTVGG